MQNVLTTEARKARKKIWRGVCLGSDVALRNFVSGGFCSVSKGLEQTDRAAMASEKVFSVLSVSCVVNASLRPAIDCGFQHQERPSCS